MLSTIALRQIPPNRHEYRCMSSGKTASVWPRTFSTLTTTGWQACCAVWGWSAAQIRPISLSEANRSTPRQVIRKPDFFKIDIPLSRRRLLIGVENALAATHEYRLVALVRLGLAPRYWAIRDWIASNRDASLQSLKQRQYKASATHLVRIYQSYQASMML